MQDPTYGPEIEVVECTSWTIRLAVVLHHVILAAAEVAVAWAVIR